MNCTKGDWKANEHRQVMCGDKVICFIGLRGHMGDDEDEPNGNLIAAAPDMHKELERTDVLIDQYQVGRVSAGFVMNRLISDAMTNDRKKALAKPMERRMQYET